MNALCQILQNDSGDAEIISYALETLVNVTSPQALEEEGISLSILYGLHVRLL